MLAPPRDSGRNIWLYLEGGGDMMWREIVRAVRALGALGALGAVEAESEVNSQVASVLVGVV